MTFAHPHALFFGLIALPIIVLYLRRLRWRRQAVTTGMFWEQVFAEQPARSRWMPWRTAVSAVVQLSILARSSWHWPSRRFARRGGSCWWSITATT